MPGCTDIRQYRKLRTSGPGVRLEKSGIATLIDSRTEMYQGWRYHRLARLAKTRADREVIRFAHRRRGDGTHIHGSQKHNGTKQCGHD